MSEAQIIPLQRAQRLPDDFWQAVMAAPWRYDLFQLLRAAGCAGRPALSAGTCAAAEVRSAAHWSEHRRWRLPRQRWPACSRAQEDARHDVAIYSFGLFGPNGPLPTHLTEYVHERIVHHQDHSLAAFADIFHHRATLLFYRAWADAQPAVSLDRADNSRFVDYLACLAGIGYRRSSRPVRSACMRG